MSVELLEADPCGKEAGLIVEFERGAVGGCNSPWASTPSGPSNHTTVEHDRSAPVVLTESSNICSLPPSAPPIAPVKEALATVVDVPFVTAAS